jgi:hypothetical protein
MRGERALGAGAHVVEALDDERRLRGEGALELGAEPAEVAHRASSMAVSG